MASSLEAEARPVLARLQPGDQLAQRIGALDPAEPAPPRAALDRDRTQAHALAEARAQGAAQLPDAVDQPERERALAEPGLAAEQLGLVGGEPGAAARAHQRLEVVVDVG